MTAHGQPPGYDMSDKNNIAMPATSEATVPIISLASPTVVTQIRAACSTIGALVLVDHEVPTTLLDQVLSTGHSFFNLDHEVKQRYNMQKQGAKWRGYMTLGAEHSLGETHVDCKEGLYMGDEHGTDQEMVKANMPTFGSNVFPDAELPGMRPLFIEYHQHMKRLGDRMMDLLSLSLGLEQEYLQTHVTKHDPVILPRMFRNPPAPQPSTKTASTEEGHWGIGGHSDEGLWTMLLTDRPGVAFQDRHGSWVAAPFVKHAIVMNVGDVLDRLTSGQYLSPYHRDRNPSTTEYQLSLLFSYDPAWNARLHALPTDYCNAVASKSRPERCANTNITGEFDGSVEYSEFLSRKVAKLFPDLVPEKHWRPLKSTSLPSNRHALGVDSPDVVTTKRVEDRVKSFYKKNTQIKTSHGLSHVLAVYNHAVLAVAAHKPPLDARTRMEVLTAALLHDMDDSKYFPAHGNYENARQLLAEAAVCADSAERIVYMIGLVSCSKNGNKVPQSILDLGDYHLLIPRWADRLEAVGKVGVVRCYQYSVEKGQPLSSAASPAAKCVDDVRKYATAERFEQYQMSGGSSPDMISHYYDKLLHVACPPKKLVRNCYLEQMASESSKELVEVCVRFGTTGRVDEDYILGLEKELQGVKG